MENPDPNNNENKNSNKRNSNGSHISMSSDNTSQLDSIIHFNENNRSLVLFKPDLASNSKNMNHTINNSVAGAVKKGLEERQSISISKKTTLVALVSRVFEVIASLIPFSVMAADNTPGWSGDSFHRYKEYRYCLAVNGIGFVYAGFQVIDLGCHLCTVNHFISNDIRYYFDFSMDQILAYLVMSASSLAATRVDDWISNWGNKKFTTMLAHQ